MKQIREVKQYILAWVSSSVLSKLLSLLCLLRVNIVVLVIRVYKHIQPSLCYMRRVVDMFCLDVIVNSTPCMHVLQFWPIKCVNA